MNSKVHSQGRVPFSWENKPGESKVSHQDYPIHVGLLPPPPCPTEKGKVSPKEFQQVPLPPCTFQTTQLRSLSKRGLIYKKQDEDPFFNAYKECTKSGTSGENRGVFWGKRDKGSWNMFGFSCKKSCSVRDDNLMKVSKLPRSLSEKERIG